jgi:hypothetical protein
MFITLTNASPAHKGKTLYINSNTVVTVYRADAVRAVNETGEITEKEEVTFVYCPPHGSWEVSESPDEVVAMLNA